MVKNSAEELNKFRIGNVLSKTPIDVTKKDYFRESETWKHCNEDCHICMAVNYLKTGDVNTIPDDYMIEFSRVGNQYIDYFNAINGIQTSHRADYDENSDI